MLYYKERMSNREKAMIAGLCFLFFLVLLLFYRINYLEKQIAGEDLSAPLYNDLSNRIDNIEVLLQNLKEILPQLGKKIGVNINNNLKRVWTDWNMLQSHSPQYIAKFQHKGCLTFGKVIKFYILFYKKKNNVLQSIFILEETNKGLGVFFYFWRLTIFFFVFVFFCDANNAWIRGIWKSNRPSGAVASRIKATRHSSWSEEKSKCAIFINWSRRRRKCLIQISWPRNSSGSLSVSQI